MQKAKSPPIDREEVSHRLRDIGRAELKVEALETEMNGELDKVRSRFSHRLETLVGHKADLVSQLRLACTDSRQDLLPGKPKSLTVLFGTIGWRTQGSQLKPAAGLDADEIIRRIQATRLTVYLRQRLEVDKPAIKRQLSNGALRQSHLREFGLRLVRGREDWWYETNHDEVAKHAEEE